MARPLGPPRSAYRLPAILLWMHNGFGYIYDSIGLSGPLPAPKAVPQKDANMSIEQFIDNEVKSNDVVLFMKGTPQFPQCGFSGQVVQILDHVGVGYKGLNVLESADLRNGIKTYSNWPTIPQLYVKGEFVGGCDIIREMFQAGELQQLLADKGVTVSAAASA
jgi:monothiol glutaredoxin